MLLSTGMEDRETDSRKVYQATLEKKKKTCFFLRNKEEFGVTVMAYVTKLEMKVSLRVVARVVEKTKPTWVYDSLIVPSYPHSCGLKALIEAVNCSDIC